MLKRFLTPAVVLFIFAQIFSGASLARMATNADVHSSVAIHAAGERANAGPGVTEPSTLLWSIRLQTLGWQDPYVRMAAEMKQAQRAAGSTTHANRVGSRVRFEPVDGDIGEIWRRELALDAAGQVYVGFGVKREQPDAAKAIRVVTLDGRHGAVVRRMDLPTPMLDRTAVLLAGDGTLLVVAGDRVHKVNNDGVLGTSISIPPQPKINPGLWVNQSASGRTLMLTTDDKAFRFVRTDTLATVAECRMENDEVHTLTDNLALSMAEGTGGQFELHSGPFCGPMPLLWTLADRSSSVHLLEDRSVLEIGPHEVRRLTLGDKTMWSWKSPEGTLPEDVSGTAISRNGERLAVEVTAFRMLRLPGCMECKGPESESWVVGIAVLDAATGQQVAEVPLEHADQNRLAFALSPDGRKLAVLHAGVLELWAV